MSPVTLPLSRRERETRKHRPRPSIILREEPEKDLAEAGEKAALVPFLLGEALAVGEVLLDHRFDLGRESAVVDGHVGLAVLRHRAVDEIDGPDRAPDPVHD